MEFWDTVKQKQHTETSWKLRQADTATVVNLMFVDPCIIVQSIRKIQQDATMYQNFIFLYLYKAQYVSDHTPPIIRSLKLHWLPLVFHTWKAVGRVVGGRCQAQCCA
jgi:hypothetical protein